MKTNLKHQNAPRTHEGAISVNVSAAKELRRTVMANMLFEDTFYESGVDAATRMADLIKRVSFADAAQIAVDAREKFKLRHAPLFLVREILRLHKGRQVGDLIARVIQRPDECGELLALYWKDNKEAPLASQLKIGLARALKKFNEYQLAKWNKDGAVKLRDVLFLSHARPKDEAQKAIFDKLAANELATPDTWEVALSEGADKKATFERLIIEKKLGALALLRNLRGMLEAGVAEDVIRDGLATMNTERVLPFRFITAARYAPRLEDALEQAMFRALAEQPKLPGKTALLIDHSGSMNEKLSTKSEVLRFDTATGLAMILRECAERARVFTFSNTTVEVPPRRGFALAQACMNSMQWGGTALRQGVESVYREFPECERLIVITDEQSMDRPAQPKGRGYIVNVGTYQNGIAYGPWVSIDGWSEAILDYVRASEAEESEA
jgi:60 kDa SS-A/Ro ribonucleoprotein